VRAFEKSGCRRKLVLVGGNAYSPEYETQIRSTSCGGIVFPGFVFGHDYEQLLANCYCYVQPSALEGTSPSLLAAMGAGAAVLVSDIPENKETVDSAGFTFQSGDVDDLAGMLKRLEELPEEVESKGRQALARVKAKYSWREVSGSLLELLSSNATDSGSTLRS
jgi:glycosyltransferase involved in cell wall biosynthesis